MPSAKQPSAKPAAAIVNATAKTRSVIESLQARLTAEVRHQTPAPQTPAIPVAPNEPMDDLERELQAYFDQAVPKPGQEPVIPSRDQLLQQLRDHVIDEVVDRILAEWARSQPAGTGPRLGREVMDRLVERVLDEFRKSAESPQAGS